MSGKYKTHVITDRSITLILDDGMIPISSSNILYSEVRAALEDEDFDLAVEIADAKTRIEKRTGGDVKVKDGCIEIDGEAIPEVLAKRIQLFIKQRLDHKLLMAFWQNVKNASREVQAMLFPFLEHNGIAITPNGCFIAYKRTNEDDFDIHTRKNKHVKGKYISMPKSEVDSDPNNTCSRGLHVADFSYADEIYGNGNLWMVEVNPKDVVAVPTDYQQRKMRTCGYKCLEKVDGPREEAVYSDDPSYFGIDTEAHDGQFIDDGDVAVQETTTRKVGDDIILRLDMHRTKNKRLTLTAKLLRHLGAEEGDRVFVICNKMHRKILVSMEEPSNGSEEVITLTVDRYINVQLRENVFKAASLGNRAKFRVTGHSTHISIEAG